MKKTVGIIWLGLIVAALMLSGCKGKEKPAPIEPAPVDKPAVDKPAEPVETKAPYRIGALFAISGPASSLGLPEEQTVKMLVEKINAKGGVNGHPVEVIIYDTKADATETVSLAKRLVENDKVSVVIGPTTSGPSLSIIDYFAEVQIPLVSCAASYKIVTDEEGNARKWIFKTPQSDSMAVEKIYEHFNKKGISKIAIMTVTNGYGDSGREELVRLAPAFNLEIVADEKFGPDDMDMTPQLTKIKGTDAKAIVVWAIQKPPAIVAKNHKTLGMDIMLVQSHGVASKTFIELCGDAADGQILPAGRLLVVDQLPADDPQKSLLAEYKKEFEEKHGPVSTFGGHAYDALLLVLKAMEKAGDDPAKIRDELENIEGFVGTGGIFNMSPADHNGLTKDAFVMVEIINNDWKLLEE